MPPLNMGAGTGIGDNFAKTRLLLAKRAGYLPENFQLEQSQGGPSMQWRAASKNLAADARADGNPNPIAWLRNRAQQAAQQPAMRAGRGHIDPGGLAYANSSMAQKRTAIPLANFVKPPQQNHAALLQMLMGQLGQGTQQANPQLLLQQLMQRGRKPMPILPRQLSGMGM